MTRLLISGLVTGEGGIQTHLNYLAKMLDEEKIETLFVSKKVTEEQRSIYSSVRFISYVSNVDEFDKSSVNVLRNIYNFKNIIEEFKPDIYMAVGTGFNSIIPTYLTRHKYRKVFHEVMSGIKSGWKDPRWLVRWHFDEVVAHTPTVAQNFAKNFGWNKEIPVLSAIPAPLELAASLPKPVRKIVPIGQAKAAFFSRLVPHKGAFWLVRQWDALKDVLCELHIHGSGPEETLIRDYIDTHGIGDRVKYFGRYPEGQAYINLLSTYDLTLLPTLGDEGAPLVLLESLACGVPFVTYGVGGISDFSINNPNIVVVPPEQDLENLTRTSAEKYDSTFILSVRDMLSRLANGQIDQVSLQQFYLEHYSYATLKQIWLSYLCS
jgi:glycosyltransferase involved in cell wall biosynthesis